MSDQKNQKAQPTSTPAPVAPPPPPPPSGLDMVMVKEGALKATVKTGK